MNGREIFEKYGKVITVLVKLLKLLPKSFRLWFLSANRNINGKFGFLFRYLAIASLANCVGKNVAIFPGVYFEHVDNLVIGDNVSIHQMCYLDAEGGIIIGKNVSIAHRCTVLSSNHNYLDLSVPIKYQGMNTAKTIINENVWIGCGCVILAGAEIGTGSVIGANSTVVKSVPNNSVAVGSPVQIIKKRDELEITK